MIVLICILLPPLFLMFMRDKVLGDKVKCNFYGTLRDFIMEYLISTIFLNLTVWAIVFMIFHHDISLEESITQYMGFAFHYILLAVCMAAVEPFVENIFRFHIKFKISYEKFKSIRFKKIDWIIYVYAIILCALNFIRIFDNSFWGDEGFSIRLAKMTVPDMINSTAEDVHPPLYYLFTQVLYHILGDNGATYHLSALLPYIIIIIISCTLIKKYFGNISTIVVITMSSLMKSAVVYNVEARMYSLAAMFVLIAYISFYMMITRNRIISWIIFGFASLAAAYTHYYALISVAFLYVMLIPLAVKKFVKIKKVILLYLATIIGYIPWLMILVKSFKRTADTWWVEEIPTLEECYIFLLDYKWFSVVILVIICVALAYRLQFLKIKTDSHKSLKEKFDFQFRFFEKIGFDEKAYWIVAGIVSICGTVIVGLLLSHMVRPFFMARYIYQVSAMLYLIVGVCLSELKFSGLWSIIFTLIILLNELPAYMITFKADRKLNMSTTEFLENVKPGKDAEIVTNNVHLAWTLLEYYYPENSKLYNGDLSDIVEQQKDDIWIFWTNCIDDTTQDEILSKGYNITNIYDGYFANGALYYVYELKSSDN